MFEKGCIISDLGIKFYRVLNLAILNTTNKSDNKVPWVGGIGGVVALEGELEASKQINKFHLIKTVTVFKDTIAA